MPELNLKNGDVSAYGFMCGYSQIARVGEQMQIKNPFGGWTNVHRFEVQLFADGVFHVRVSDWRLPLGLEAWYSFDKLSEARKYFKKAVKFYSSVPLDYRAQRYDPRTEHEWIKDRA